MSGKSDNFDFSYPPIENSFEGEIVKRSVAEQYFESRYCKSDDDDYCVLFHSNRICIVTLAKTHSIVQKRKEITKIDFKQTTTSTTGTSTTGSKKKKPLQPNTIVCMIHCSDESSYKVRGLVRGKLIEINENLVNDPSLLVQEPAEDGYLFIILPSIADYESFKKKYACTIEGSKVIS